MACGRDYVVSAYATGSVLCLDLHPGIKAETAAMFSDGHFLGGTWFESAAPGACTQQPAVDVALDISELFRIERWRFVQYNQLS